MIPQRPRAMRLRCCEDASGCTVRILAICNCLGRRGIAKRTLLSCDRGLKNERKVQIILNSRNADQITRSLSIVPFNDLR